MQKKITTIIILLVVIIGGWYIISKNNPSDEGEVSKEAVSVVNGSEITLSELELTKSQLLQMQGADLESLDEETKVLLEAQALDILINQKLLEQAVEKSRISANKKEVNEQLESIKSRFEDSVAYEKALVEENTTEKELITKIKTNIITQKFLEEKLSLESITATEEEVTAAYEESIIGSEFFPTLEEVYGQVESSVIQQKQQILVNEFIQGLRESAQIETLI